MVRFTDRARHDPFVKPQSQSVDRCEHDYSGNVTAKHQNKSKPPKEGEREGNRDAHSVNKTKQCAYELHKTDNHTTAPRRSAERPRCVWGGGEGQGLNSGV